MLKVEAPTLAPRIRVQNILGPGMGAVVVHLERLPVLLGSQGNSNNRIHSALVLRLAPHRRKTRPWEHQVTIILLGGARESDPILLGHSLSGTQAPLAHSQKHHHLGHHHAFLRGQTQHNRLGKWLPSPGNPNSILCEGPSSPVDATQPSSQPNFLQRQTIIDTVRMHSSSWPAFPDITKTASAQPSQACQCASVTCLHSERTTSLCRPFQVSSAFPRFSYSVLYHGSSAAWADI